MLNNILNITYNYMHSKVKVIVQDIHSRCIGS